MLSRPNSTSAAAPLAWAWAGLVLYASLFPFTGWRWPPGATLTSLLALPWPPWNDLFDLWANVLGYWPWGWLLAAACFASGRPTRHALLVATLIPALTSYAVEVTQSFLPGRHPSLKDLATNSLGAFIGGCTAVVLHRLGVTNPWLALRRRWFVARSGGALALLALWPFALLFPTPMPLGLGQVGPLLREWLLVAIDDVPWAAGLQALLATSEPVATISPLSEGMATALGLFAPCMVALAVARPGLHRWLLILGAAAASICTMTLSAILNFGPSHAWAWQTATTLPAMACATLAAMALAASGSRVACGLALAALAGAVALVAQAPPDPYLAQNLQAWEQGRWVRFHGVTQWVGYLWPFLAMLWLLQRLSQRDEPG